MKSNIQKHADVTVVSLQGKITIGEGDVRLRQCVNEVLEDGAKKIILDLQDVSYMDSSGVATLVEALQAAQANATAMILCNLQNRVQSIFEIARLDTIFTIQQDLRDAISG